ncbi:MAG: glycine cleavage system protein H [Proteobacteria bacterium]|nr:glycine cleavage system protein H [Pseudomonadota bacterium]
MLFKNLKDIAKGKTQKIIAKARPQSNIVKGFKVIEDECIWSKAGIVQSRLCDNVYDCRTCPFDRAMQKTVNADSNKRGSGWANNVKDVYNYTNIPCRHALTGRVTAAKVCVNNYECNHCAFDQMLDDEDMDYRDEKTACLKSSGYLLAEEYYYHKGHTWARFEHGGRVRIGFDDFMVKLFGSPSNISLPHLGAKLKKDQAGLAFSRSDKEAAVKSPVTGTVLAINNRVQEHPEIVHEDPYNEGWLCIIEPKMPKLNLRGLFYGKDSLEWTDRESQRLLRLIGPEYQNLAAAGGEPVDDIYASFPEIGWDRLAETFLGSAKK